MHLYAVIGICFANKKLYFIHSRKWWEGNCNYFGGTIPIFVHIEHSVFYNQVSSLS